MAKAYWISAYRSVSDPAALAKYAELAGPAIAAGGGRFLARGAAEHAFEAGVTQRTVIIEFDSMEAAVACYTGEAYAKALAIVTPAAQRDIRIVAGI